MIEYKHRWKKGLDRLLAWQVSVQVMVKVPGVMGTLNSMINNCGFKHYIDDIRMDIHLQTGRKLGDQEIVDMIIEGCNAKVITINWWIALRHWAVKKRLARWIIRKVAGYLTGEDLFEEFKLPGGAMAECWFPIKPLRSINNVEDLPDWMDDW